MLRVVLDTNVVVSSLRSSRGASSAVMELLSEGRYELVVSVASFLEYDEQLQRLVEMRVAAQAQVDDLLDFVGRVAIQTAVPFRLRPALSDADDDFALELAVAGNVDYLVTHNASDFVAAGRYGIGVVRPAEFLRVLEQAQ